MSCNSLQSKIFIIGDKHFTFFAFNICSSLLVMWPPRHPHFGYSQRHILTYFADFVSLKHIWYRPINSTAQCKSGVQGKTILTFCIKETGLLAAVDHFLLALLRPWYDGPKLFGRGAVVELHDVWFVKRGALDRNRSWAVVRQHRPHLLLWKKKS